MNGWGCGGPVWILAATVELHDKPVRIVNVHLSAREWPERAAWRADQERFIKNRFVDPFAGRVVVTGDFNEPYDVVEPRLRLSDAYATAPNLVQDAAGGTHCGDEGRRFDLILPRYPMTTFAYDGVYCPGDLSDHQRVSAMLALGSTPAPLPDPEPGDEELCDKKPWTPGC